MQLGMVRTSTLWTMLILKNTHPYVDLLTDTFGGRGRYKFAPSGMYRSGSWSSEEPIGNLLGFPSAILPRTPRTYFPYLPFTSKVA